MGGRGPKGFQDLLFESDIFYRAIRGERFFLPPGLRDRFYRQTRISAFEKESQYSADMKLLERAEFLASGR